MVASVVRSNPLPVHVPPVPDLHHRNGVRVVVYFIKDAKRTLANSVAVVPCELFAPMRPTLVTQALNPGHDAAAVLVLKSLQLLYRRRLDPKLIACHSALDP